MNEEKKSCFGYKLSPDWYKTIKNFELKWTVLKIKHKVSIINKVHVLVDHIPQFILKTGKPLGEFSEQVVESCHQKWARLYKWYAVKEVLRDKI